MVFAPPGSANRLRGCPFSKGGCSELLKTRYIVTNTSILITYRNMDLKNSVTLGLDCINRLEDPNGQRTIVTVTQSKTTEERVEGLCTDSQACPRQKLYPRVPACTVQHRQSRSNANKSSIRLLERLQPQLTSI